MAEKIKKEIKTIVILGMHRSGTSMVAGVLDILGVNMGKELEEANKWNPVGYFENKKFMAINKEITDEEDGLIINIPTLEKILLKKEKFIQKIKNIIKQEETNFWGWKDPRTSLTIDLFLPFLKNPHFIVCFRNPLEVAKSLRKRDGFSILEGLRLTMEYNKRIINFLDKHKELKCLYLSYEQIINNKQKELNKITAFLGINLNKKLNARVLKFILSKKSQKFKAAKHITKFYIKKLIKYPHRIPRFIYKKIVAYGIKKKNKI